MLQQRCCGEVLEGTLKTVGNGFDVTSSFRRWFGSLPMICLLALVILIWRRPVELHHAYIWVEEGTVSLPEYLRDGWLSLFSPIAGYLLVPAKAIFLTAASLSASHLPQVAYWLAIVFEVATVALIAFSPTHLKYPRLAALAVLLIPTQPEVYAVSEYAFWWGSLWSFVAIFWRDAENPRTGWRLALVVIGGLSSPMCIPAAVLLGYRAFSTRKKSDWSIAAVGTAIAALQLTLMLLRGPVGEGNRRLDLYQLIARFFGNFVVSSANIPLWLIFLVGMSIVIGLVAYGWFNRKWRDPYFVMLAGCLGAALLASISRVPVEVLHPVLSGPRYFFYPYIFLSWLLLYAFSEVRMPARAMISAAFLIALVQFSLHGRQSYETFRWRAELQNCVARGDEAYRMPVQFAGPKEIAWHVELTGLQCQELIDRSIFK